MATSPYRYYLDVISNWPTAIAPESQWFINFDLPTVGALKDISNVQKYDSGSGSDTVWNIPQTTVNKLISKENQFATESLIGCVFAREVTVPGESIDAGNVGLDYGGYQAPATSNGRNKYGKLHVVFSETNSSFLDFVIRPWIILVGYYGLLARGEKSPKKVKCNYADVVYIAKTGPYSPSIQRKIIRYFNIAPVSIGSISNTYASEGMQYKGVDFVYDYYSVLDPSSGASGDLNPALNNPSNTNKVSTTIIPTGINSAGNVSVSNQSITSPTGFGEASTLTFPSGKKVTTGYAFSSNNGVATFSEGLNITQPR
ncbi:MAG: hypothetical protein EBU90_00805 [Proteobacteria bacterium]|nr:hypothetical protein [Pseudomonadota bacterium]NBP12972.1 hypothetical protein [bacterium]